MIQGKWFAPGADLSSVIPLRQSVFCRGRDSLDDASWNALIWEDDTPAATGRIWYQDGIFRIGDICVLPPFRCRRLGDLALRLLLFKAQSHAAGEVRLRCPADTAGFFARLGFHILSEEPDGVEMSISGNQIELDSCKSCPKSGCPNRR